MGRMRFQSTLPARGATLLLLHQADGVEFQSALPARGATYTGQGVGAWAVISIHAPREGSDRALPGHKSH